MFAGLAQVVGSLRSAGPSQPGLQHRVVTLDELQAVMVSMSVSMPIFGKQSLASMYTLTGTSVTVHYNRMRARNTAQHLYVVSLTQHTQSAPNYDS